GDDVWLDRALRITRRVLDGYARDYGWRIPEHFSASWEPLPEYNDGDRAHQFRPFGATVGHSLEWARLALHVRDALVTRGRAADGADGFLYTVDFAGEPVVHERMHWVVCEAIAAAAALEMVTRQERYAEWYQRGWDYAASRLIERPGEWRHELDASNEPSA